MTTEEILKVIDYSGAKSFYGSTWSRQMHKVPFDKSCPVLWGRFYLQRTDGSDTGFYIKLPIEGESYTARQLSSIHKWTMTQLKYAKLDMPVEVLETLRHCT